MCSLESCVLGERRDSSRKELYVLSRKKGPITKKTLCKNELKPVFKYVNIVTAINCISVYNAQSRNF